MARSIRFKNPLLKLDTHFRIYIALSIALIVYLVFRKQLSTSEQILATWIGYALTHIILDWVLIIKSHPRQICKLASLEDSSRSLIFIVVIGAAVASLVAIIFLLKSPKGTSEAIVTGHVILSISSVIVSWWMVHTVFAMRYAYVYYDTNDDAGNIKPMGGLEFPKEPDPDYLDFVYFSYVIGMTFQVSDVEISSREIRRLAWMHGLISFAFNTAIVALSINIISGLVAH